MLSTGLSVENRGDWEQELIRFYLDQLQQFTGIVVNMDEAVLHYRQQLLMALAFWTGTLVHMPGMPDMQPRETSMEFIKRITHACDEWDALASF